MTPVLDMASAFDHGSPSVRPPCFRSQWRSLLWGRDRPLVPAHLENKAGCAAPPGDSKEEGATSLLRRIFGPSGPVGLQLKGLTWAPRFQRSWCFLGFVFIFIYLLVYLFIGHIGGGEGLFLACVQEWPLMVCRRLYVMLKLVPSACKASALTLVLSHHIKPIYLK